MKGFEWTNNQVGLLPFQPLVYICDPACMRHCQVDFKS